MKKLIYDELLFRLDSNLPRFKDTDHLKECQGIIGQNRAVKAIEMGLDMRQEGYNIFISGMKGTGRSTTIKKLLDKLAGTKKVKLEDKVFVHNFRYNEQPLFLSMKAGQGRKLKKYMHTLVKHFIKIIPSLLEEFSFKNERNQILEKHNSQKKELIKNFENNAGQWGFKVVQTQEGKGINTVLLPILDEKPVEFAVLEEMAQKGEYDKAKLEEIKMIHRRLILELEQVVSNIAQIDEKIESKIEALITKAVEPKVKEYINNISKFFNNRGIKNYLNSVAEFIIENPNYFFIDFHKEQYQNVMSKSLQSLPGRLYIFDINIIVDNSSVVSPPVIIENSPTVRNLFGTIEKSVDKKGIEYTSFLNIKSGSLIQADGGYLVIDAEDMVNERNVYHLLKRILKTREHTIQPLEQYYYQGTSALKPESIPLTVKVILIGSEHLYDHLHYNDDEFTKIFKVKAQFDSEIDNSLENQVEYGSFVKMLCSKEGLKPLTFDAFEQVLRFSSRLTGNRNKLSTLFTDIADLIREADYFSQLDKSGRIEIEHIRKAIKAKEYMYNLIQEKMLEFIDQNIILINTKDLVVGQINALVVQSSGELKFGIPARITVSTSIGEQGIVNIEREAELSGSFFDKAVLIIDGYLRKIFAQDKPLSVNVSLAFEQSYGHVEGDSASQAEIIAILSSLSDIPIKQYLAITGSVNQIGEIQTIGGVNEKIEGFFNVCRMRGLEKGQGVIIPERNVNDINLNDDVLDAVREGTFEIWAVSRVEESVEIMMGTPAGSFEKNEYFTPGSVYDISNKKLWEYANTWKKWSNTD